MEAALHELLEEINDINTAKLRRRKMITSSYLMRKEIEEKKSSLRIDSTSDVSDTRKIGACSSNIGCQASIAP